MSRVNLRDFQRLTQLSDSSLLWLLQNNRLKVDLDPRAGVLVSLDNQETKSLVEALKARKQNFFERKPKILKERLASIVADHLDDILDEAIERLSDPSTLSAAPQPAESELDQDGSAAKSRRSKSR
ncbi:MAG: hypothetical protein DCC75_11530 [Proteobacteria bacterium]|nr:MAG: hypothetical protein DCC75_11530 [Pseudomonadota bacterium]